MNMPIIAGKPENQTEYQLAPTGTHMARVYQIMNFGTQEVEWQGKQKTVKQIRIFWELVDESKDIEVEENGKKIKKTIPYSISREITLSMGDKSNLRPIIEGIIGTTLNDTEAYAFDVESIIDMPHLVRITHKKNKAGDKTYAVVESTSELMKGQKCPELRNEKKILNVTEMTEEEIDELNEFYSEKMKESLEFKYRKEKENQDPDVIDASLIPF